MIINIIAILVYFFLAYATYYRSQKYNANPYIWFLIGLFLPYFGYLVALLYFRRKMRLIKILPCYLLVLEAKGRGRWLWRHCFIVFLYYRPAPL